MHNGKSISHLDVNAKKNANGSVHLQGKLQMLWNLICSLSLLQESKNTIFYSLQAFLCMQAKKRILLFGFAFPSFREYYHTKLNFTAVSVFLGHNAVYTFEQYNFFQNRTSILLLTVNAMKNVFEIVFFLEFSVETNAIEFIFSISFFFCACSILSFFSEGPGGGG